MKYLSAEELAKLLGQVPELEPATANDIVRIIARARADAGFREALIDLMARYLGGALGRWALGGLSRSRTLRSSG